LDIQDAFFYTNLKIADQKVLFRIGRQAVNWGEGLLYPGINAFNASDYAWATMPGATVSSGGFLPVNRVYVNVAFPRGLNIDGFYNLEWRSDISPGCGTWYSFVDNGFQPGCNTIVSAGAPDQVVQTGGALKSYWGRRSRQAVRFPMVLPTILMRPESRRLGAIWHRRTLFCGGNQIGAWCFLHHVP